MNIVIVGNRIGWNYQRVEQVLLQNNVHKSDVIITGGAEGVDTFAIMYAKKAGCKCIIINPDTSIKSPDRYYKRNLEMVLMCDVVIAFNKKNEIRTGTHNTITQAKSHNRKVIEVAE